MFKSTEKYNIYTSADKNNTTFISDANPKDFDTAIDNIEGCTESAGVRINFMKS